MRDSSEADVPLSLVRIEAPRVPVVEVDDYIALSVDWVPVGSVRPVYYRALGTEGGDIEIKIEPLRGEIIGLVVIENPVLNVTIPHVATTNDLLCQGSAIVDKSKWNPNPDAVPTVDVAYEKCHISVGEDEHNIYYALCDEVPNRFVMSGSVGFGVTSNALIAGILVRKP